eukprot:Lankesteria_metandrocarpae@DN609_c0_g1_i1.p1
MFGVGGGDLGVFGNLGEPDRSGFGGGGFLPGAGFSSQADFGGGGRQSTGPTTSAASTCVPLKAAMIFNAHNAMPTDTQLTILGQEVTFFKLVGFITDTLPSDGQRIAFNLNDGTASIRVEWYIRWLSESTSPYRQRKYDALQDDYTWVAVYGEINLLGKLEPHVKASMVRKLENFTEIHYHTLDVASFAMRSKYGDAPGEPHASTGTNNNPAPGAGNSERPGWKEPGGAAASSWTQHTGGNTNNSQQPHSDVRSSWHQNSSVGGNQSTMGGGGGALDRVVVDSLKELSKYREAGVNIGELRSRVMNAGCADDCSEQAIRTALSRLSAEGSVYFTKDQNHWKA